MDDFDLYESFEKVLEDMIKHPQAYDHKYITWVAKEGLEFLGK